MGGFTAGRADLVELLRQKSRPYLFSNSLAPVIAATSLYVLKMLAGSTQLRDRLFENTRYLRSALTVAGFSIKPGTHPIIPVMVFEESLAQRFAQRLYELGIFVTGFCYPVVPMGQARVRVQLSAAHTRQQLDDAIDAMSKVGRELGILRAQA